VLPTENILLQLSSQFNKTSTTRKLRIDIFDFYATLLSIFGSDLVKTNYTLIVNHKLVQPRSYVTKYEKLLVQTPEVHEGAFERRHRHPNVN